MAMSALAACATDVATEAVVHVSTDLSIPSDLDEVRFVVDSAALDGRVTTRSVLLDAPDAPEMPLTLTIAHRGGPLGPVRVEVEGLRRGHAEVVQAITFDFVREVTLFVPVELTTACANVECGPRSSCVRGSCEPVGSASPDAGTPPMSDAGTVSPDAAQDAGPPDVCGDQVCGAGACECSGSCGCQLECGERATCDAIACRAESTCDVHARKAGSVRVQCESSSCVVDARETSQAVIVCGAGSTCDVDCKDSESCMVACEPGAVCSVKCEHAEACEITTCDGAVEVCGHEEQVCGAGCG